MPEAAPLPEIAEDVDEARERGGDHPRLTDAQLARLEQVGRRRRVVRGDVLYRVGDRSYDWYAVLSGAVAVVGNLGHEEPVVRVHGPRRFLGGLDILRSTPVARTAVVVRGGDVTTSPSVRKVAERARVSVGSLRYHFPTQQSLHDEVMKQVYSTILSDDPIHADSVPARERLVSCLRQVLAPVGVGAQARAEWRKVFDAFMPSEASEQVDAAHAAAVGEGRRRVEYWLAVLTTEGELPEGDNQHRARFLCTVLNGLAVERALPADDSLLEAETAALYTAVDCVMSTRST